MPEMASSGVGRCIGRKEPPANHMSIWPPRHEKVGWPKPDQEEQKFHSPPYGRGRAKNPGTAGAAPNPAPTPSHPPQRKEEDQKKPYLRLTEAEKSGTKQANSGSHRVREYNTIGD